MVSYSIHRLDNFTDEYLDTLAELSARAFNDGEPAILMVNGQNRTIIVDYWRAILAAGRLEGEVYVATLDDSHVPVSVSVWFPPGKTLYATEEQRTLGYYDWLMKLDPETREFISITFIQEIDKFFNGALSPRNETDTWVCYLVATDPPYQQNGIGTALVKDIYPRAKGKDSILSFCTTNKRNADWYEKMGFTIMGFIPKLEGPKGSTPVWGFRKAVD